MSFGLEWSRDRGAGGTILIDEAPGGSRGFVLRKLRWVPCLAGVTMPATHATLVYCGHWLLELVITVLNLS